MRESNGPWAERASQTSGAGGPGFVGRGLSSRWGGVHSTPLCYGFGMERAERRECGRVPVNECGFTAVWIRRNTTEEPPEVSQHREPRAAELLICCTLPPLRMPADGLGRPCWEQRAAPLGALPVPQVTDCAERTAGCVVLLVINPFIHCAVPMGLLAALGPVLLVSAHPKEVGMELGWRRSA